jgi:hypothetical protein
MLLAGEEGTFEVAVNDSPAVEISHPPDNVPEQCPGLGQGEDHAPVKEGLQVELDVLQDQEHLAVGLGADDHLVEPDDVGVAALAQVPDLGEHRGRGLVRRSPLPPRSAPPSAPLRGPPAQPCAPPWSDPNA